MTSIKQPSMAGGFLSPQLLGRTDINKYQSGLAECRNFSVQRFGGIQNRSGTQYIGTTIGSTKARLVKWVVDQQTSYLLVFTTGRATVYKNGAAISVSGVTTPWDIGTAYTQGQIVVKGAVYYVARADNTGEDPSIFPALDWMSLIGTDLAIPIPSYAADRLPLIQYAQLNDIMVITDQSANPYRIIRMSDTLWTHDSMTSGTIQPGLGAPSGVMVTAGVGPSPSPAAPTGITAVGGFAGGGNFSHYRISSYSGTQEGPAAVAVTSTVGIANLANPVALSWTPVGGVTGYVIYKNADGPSAAGSYYIAALAKTTATYSDTGFPQAVPIRLLPTAAAGATVFSYEVTSIDANGVESLGSAPVSVTANTPTEANPNVISWTALAGAVSYNIYRSVNGRYSYIGTSDLTSFNDTGLIIPDISIQPPVTLDMLATANDFPQCVSFYQQRLLFANTINQPQTIWGSRTGAFFTFSVSTPVIASDAIQFTIAGRQVQTVNAMIDLGKLILHTSGGEYVATGDQSGALTPTSIGLVQQGYSGCAQVVPVGIGNSDIFVQARGSIIRDLKYDIQATAYQGKDCTVFAPSLFEGTSIVAMDWQQIFNSTVLAVKADGYMAWMTYIREHDIWAWSRHDTFNGLFEDVCTCPEAAEDVIYTIVNRTISGSEVRYIERFAERELVTSDDGTEVRDWATCVFADCSLTYDGRVTTGQTATLTTGAGWTPTDAITVTLSFSADYKFTLADVGNSMVFQQVSANGTVTDSVTLNIVAWTSATVVTAIPTRDVPTWAQVASTTWGKAVHHFTGIDHLEGQTLTALGDGNVVRDPMVVSGGAFDTTNNYLILTAGLPITAQAKTLPIENAQGETVSNKRVMVNEATIIFYKTRGGAYGQDAEHLFDLYLRADENWDAPNALVTGNKTFGIQGTWEDTGQIFIQQTDPLPIGISAVVVTGQVGT